MSPLPAVAPGLPWPLPALLVWAVAWALFLTTRQALPLAAAWLLATALGVLLSRWARPGIRRCLLAGGFPVSGLVIAASSANAWVWLVLLLLTAAVYPLRAWRDAPVFPTPPAALNGIAARLPLPPRALLLDAGSGVGDGLIALARAWPGAKVAGIEWSPALAWISRLRCRHAAVRIGDMWRAGAWQGCDMVYLFQRPESMARAWRKACEELPGGWLLSLEFEVPDRRPDLCHVLPGGRQVLAWRVPGAQPPGPGADNSV